MNNESMWDYFVRNTQEYGDYDVLEFFGKKLTRTNFIEQVENSANWFLSKGYKPGDVFTIFMPNTPHAIIGFYALNKIGVICNMVHPLTPADMLEEYIIKSKSKGILIFNKLYFKHKEIVERTKQDIIFCNLSQYMPQPLKMVLGMKEKPIPYFDFSLLSNYKGKHETSNASDDGTAVYIHSSGTTDYPKTTMISNSVFNNLVQANALLFDGIEGNQKNIDNKFCSIFVVPLFHSYGIGYCMHTHLCHSIKLIVLPKPDPKAICKKLNKNKVINFYGFFELFKKIMNEKSFNYKSLKYLKSCGFGGDIIDYNIINKFNELIAQSGNDCKACEGYGLSETCSATATNTPKNYRIGSVGKALPNVEIQIWDENNKVLKANEIGEIVTSGNTMMSGYLGLPKKDTFIVKDGKEWLRTGDMGYLDTDDFLFFVSRKKRMVKIAGMNVFLQEIERVVSEIENVVESCAIEKSMGGKPFVRLFVVKSGEIAADEISKYVEMKLGKHSVPREIKFIDTLPRTGMGKVEYKKLME